MSYNTFFRIAKQSGERILKQSMYSIPLYVHLVH